MFPEVFPKESPMPYLYLAATLLIYFMMFETDPSIGLVLDSYQGRVRV
jgi:hypothetical protein